MLAYQRYGDEAAGTPLLIAHGLFGSARNWGVVARRLSARRPVIAVDMRNHGNSPWFDSHSYTDMAADLAEVIAATGAPADVIGHSMGGKAGMALALSRPELVRRLIVADIAPVNYGPSLGGEIVAMRRVDLTGVERRGDAAAQMTSLDPSVIPFLLQSLDLKERRWRLNLDVLARDMGLIRGFPDFDTAFEGPVLFLSGSQSDYVLPAYRDQIRALFPNARFAKIPGAGHWLHADKPREFEATADLFLTPD